MYKNLINLNNMKLHEFKVYDVESESIMVMEKNFPTEIYYTNEGYHIIVLDDKLEEVYVATNSNLKGKAIKYAKKDLYEILWSEPEK